MESALPRGPRDQADAPSGVEVSDDSDTDYSDTEMLPSTSNGNSSNKKKQATIVNKRKSSLWVQKIHTYSNIHEIFYSSLIIYFARIILFNLEV